MVSSEDAWADGRFDWRDANQVRACLARGADVSARLHAIENTPLHNVADELQEAVESASLLIQAGADVEALNRIGETPLWEAVRNGHGNLARVLLAAGADPWRPIFSGRSAGRVALDGPLAELFAGLPGAPVISDDERRWQAEADELIEHYGGWSGHTEGMSVAFIEAVGARAVIELLGADPDACRLTGDYDDEDQRGLVWVGSPPGGGTVVIHQIGLIPIGQRFMAAMSSDRTVTAAFDNPSGGDQRVEWWAHGQRIDSPSPFLDPVTTDADEPWLCRFGDHSCDAGDLAQDLALMTLLTGVRPTEDWFFEHPKYVVDGSRFAW